MRGGSVHSIHSLIHERKSKIQRYSQHEMITTSEGDILGKKSLRVGKGKGRGGRREMGACYLAERGPPLGWERSGCDDDAGVVRLMLVASWMKASSMFCESFALASINGIPRSSANFCSRVSQPAREEDEEGKRGERRERRYLGHFEIDGTPV